jgi:Ca2+/Na+ antiporter
MKILKTLIPYILILISTFYGLPLLGKDTGSFMVILLILMPLICIVTSFIYRKKHQSNYILPITIAILFTPTVYIYYNSSAFFYIPLYTVLSIAATLLAKVTTTKKG